MRFEIKTKGLHDIIDITDHVTKAVETPGTKDGIAVVFAPHSTVGITTIEYESALLQDIKEIFEKIAPSTKHYGHNDTWNEDNGHAHILSSIVGTSKVFPIEKGRLVLGTWQQIVLIEFDPRPRMRIIIVKVIETK